MAGEAAIASWTGPFCLSVHPWRPWRAVAPEALEFVRVFALEEVGEDADVAGERAVLRWALLVTGTWEFYSSFDCSSLRATLTTLQLYLICDGRSLS